MTRSLENRVAIVTGGSGGIGGATAKLLAQNGATVAVADIDFLDQKKLLRKLSLRADKRRHTKLI